MRAGIQRYTPSPIAIAEATIASQIFTAVSTLLESLTRRIISTTAPWIYLARGSGRWRWAQPAMAKKWTMPIHHWREALNHFTILWPDRMPALDRVAS